MACPCAPSWPMLLCGGKVGFYATICPLCRYYAIPLGNATCSRGEGKHLFLSLGESDPCLSLVVGEKEKFGDVL